MALETAVPRRLECLRHGAPVDVQHKREFSRTAREMDRQATVRADSEGVSAPRQRVVQQRFAELREAADPIPARRHRTGGEVTNPPFPGSGGSAPERRRQAAGEQPERVAPVNRRRAH